MKLPDFRDDREFNNLRNKVGAIYKDWIPAWNSIDGNALLNELIKSGEVQLNFSDLTIAADCTLELQGRKIIVYIRDQYDKYAQKGDGYKFHISDCDILARFQSDGRYSGRYVAKISLDNRFSVNIIDMFRTLSIFFRRCK